MYEYFSLAPMPDQMQSLWSALNISREIYNLALQERKTIGLEMDSLRQAANFAARKKSDPRLAVIPYRTVEALLRQIDTYTMNTHCLPNFVKAGEWKVIPFKEGVKPIGDFAVWIPKIGEVEAPEIGHASPFRMAWLVSEGNAWKLQTKPTSS